MPKPQDFGITNETWVKAQYCGPEGRAAEELIKLYREALESWKQIAAGIGNQS